MVADSPLNSSDAALAHAMQLSSKQTAAEQYAVMVKKIQAYRRMGESVTEINPIAALADEIERALLQSEGADGVDSLLTWLGGELWHEDVRQLQVKTGWDHAPDATQTRMRALAAQLANNRTGQPGRGFGMVFTAHPVFARPAAEVDAVAGAAVGESPAEPPFGFRSGITLAEEHHEALRALANARDALISLTEHYLVSRWDSEGVAGWAELPQLAQVSTWVGYDLDGRSDIRWTDGFLLRLREKGFAVERYCAALDAILPAVPAKLVTLRESLEGLRASLAVELAATTADIARFANLPEGFQQAADALTERAHKMTSSYALAAELHQLAVAVAHKSECDALAVDALAQLIALAADIRAHGFGVGEIHLRVNAQQLRNAMRAVDGRSISQSSRSVPMRGLIDRLAHRIESCAPRQINFQVLHEETATARRQLMLAAQTLKHIDSDQPIRLLIAECEQPITLLSALYLCRLFGIAHKIDISPLFETTLGLERGSQLLDQLLRLPVYRAYVAARARLAVQTGFSDAGRFMGQIAANLAIERLQIKTTEVLHLHFPDNAVQLLLFNTHGESRGRGGACGTPAERQAFVLAPHVRARMANLGVKLHHQTSFQGGDGYRMFANPPLAASMVTCLLEAELLPNFQTDSPADALYTQHDFALDFFLTLKAWHENLFRSPQYGMLLDVFGSNLLPKSGSRPTKRVTHPGMVRNDPSRMRAIPHNGILQQLGYPANVIGGLGSAAHVDIDQFVELYAQSPRLQQLVQHVLAAKTLGSLNTVLAYARLVDAGFWVDKAYHMPNGSTLRAHRVLSRVLEGSETSIAVRQTVSELRDDLLDLYRLGKQLNLPSVRVSGGDRTMLDVLHAVRIALISANLLTIAQTPRFTNMTQYTNEDMLHAALRLDFATAITTITEAFSLDHSAASPPQLAESENYSDTVSQDYAQLRAQIVTPIQQRNAAILRISQMISTIHGAHG